MGSLNRAEILGTMGADPEVKQLQGGNKVAQFTLATNDPAHKLQNGTEVPEKTEWHNIVCWGTLLRLQSVSCVKGHRCMLMASCAQEATMISRVLSGTLQRLLLTTLFCSIMAEIASRAHNSLKVGQLPNQHNKVRHRQRKVAHTVQKRMICHSKNCWSV